MKKLIPLLAITVLSTVLSAQEAPYCNFDNYTPVYCSGEVPSVFIKSANDKYKEDVREERNVAQKNKSYVSTQKENFLFKSNYFVDMLLQSGLVLFGDSITQYVNTVADRVLVNDPQLREKLSFYCLRAEEPNAFSTDQGLIFVTVGLIAQLENEAQLAFVLSHEIAHYEKRHTLSVYLEQNRIFNEQNNRGRTDFDDQIRDFSNYEKTSEFEADSLGLARLQKTGYNCEEAIAAMFVLQLSHLPFDDFKFDHTVYETSFMKFPRDLILDSVAPINIDSDEDSDEYSSHPNIASRRRRLENMLADSPGEGTLKFIESETSFLKIRNICRFECIRLELIEGNYPLAIYNATFLQSQFPNSLYLRRSIGKGLYAIAKHKNSTEYNKNQKDYDEVEGEQQRCYFLFLKMHSEQISSVALRYLYDLSKLDSSPVVKNMMIDLCADMVEYHGITLEEMRKSLVIYNEAKNDTVPPEKKDSVIVVEPKKETGGSGYVNKYDKLKSEKRKKEQEVLVKSKKAEVSKFHMLSFADILDQPDVVQLFSQGSELAAQRQTEKDARKKKYDGMSSYEQRKTEQKEKKLKGQPVPLGIDTLLIYDPFYVCTTERRGYDMVASEKERYNFIDNISDCAEAADVTTVMYDVKSFTKDDVAKYNELALLTCWFEEMSNRDELKMVLTESEYVEKITENRTSSHVMITGVYTLKERREGRGYVLFLTAVCWPLFPLGVAYAVTPINRTYFHTTIYSIDDASVNMSRTIELKSKARRGYINSQMYYIMNATKKSPKKNKSGK